MDIGSIGKEDERESDEVEQLDEQDSCRIKMNLQIQLDKTDPEKYVKIGAKLKGCLLKRKKSNFSWTTEYMPKISIDVASHQLSVNPSSKFVKKKICNLSPKRAIVINDEFKRLLGAGSIRELKYFDWFTNTIFA